MARDGGGDGGTTIDARDGWRDRGSAPPSPTAADAAGYRVGVIDVVDRPVDSTGANGHAASESIQVFSASVADEPAIEAVLDEFGTPDVVVNNAGIVRFGPLVDLDVSDFRAVVDVNLVGTYVVARAVARRWIDDGRPGCVVNVTSMNGVAAGPNAGAYGASKAAVALLTSQMAIEWGPSGIRVNAVAPGLIDAGMSEPIYADPAVRAARESKVPLRAPRCGVRHRRCRVVPRVGWRGVHPRAEHRRRRWRHRFGDRPPAPAGSGRLGGAVHVTDVLLLAGGSPHAHDFGAIGDALERVLTASGYEVTRRGRSRCCR